MRYLPQRGSIHAQLSPPSTAFVRGYEPGVYRDRIPVAGQAEYRLRITERIAKDNTICLRLDLAWRKDNRQLYFAIGEAY